MSVRRLVFRFTEHVIVPAAVIALVAAFLFYLLEVRSVFAGYSRAFRQVVLCFAVATVLIERYGRLQEDEEGQGCYTRLLAGVTILFISLRSGGLHAFLLNLVIVVAVWLFATRVTRGLALNGEGRDPAVSVAWLAVVALFAFALGEPLLLGTAPQVGERAMKAVIVFLFSAAVVLAAGSFFARLRRIEEAGGTADLGLLPVRVAIAGGLAALVLGLTLIMPRIQYRGTGSPRETTVAGRIGTGDNQDVRADISIPTSQASTERLIEELRKAQELPRVRRSASRLASSLGALGRGLLFVLIPLGLVVLVVLFLRRRVSVPGLGPDPLADLSDLGGLSPRDAVLAAYGRLLRALAWLGHPRPESHTPYETLDSLPARLQSFREPACSLTDLYVKAAYSGEAVMSDEGERAVEALRGLRGSRTIEP